MPRLPVVTLGATAVAAASMVLLLVGLPARGFFSGDAGVKLIAARSALAHPRRPFTIDLPTIGGHPVPRVDPMIVPHDDHAHVLQSPVFPVVSAPFIAMLGLRGAYLLPAVSFVLMVPLLEVVRRVATPSTPPLIVATLAVVANPLFFYALEFWEHAPAVALLTACTALIVRRDEEELTWVGMQAEPLAPPRAGVRGTVKADDRSRGRTTNTVGSLGAGVLGGIAVLLRPEAALYLLALVVAFRPAIADALAIAAGAAVVVGPLSIASYAHSGSFLGTHLTNTLAPLTRDWLSQRAARISAWLWPDSLSEALSLFALAAAWLTTLFRVSLRVRQVLGLVGVALLALLAAERSLDRNSLWQAFPVAALALLPIPSTPALRRLRLVSLIAGVLIVLTATHDGGAQWGPRFLLVIAPALLLLAAAALADVVGPGDWRPVRFAVTAAVLLGALLTNRAAYRELRGAKIAYARIVDATAAATRIGEPIVTNVWWFDQIVAPLYGTRTFLYTPDRVSANATLRELATANQQGVSLVWTRETEGEPLDAALDGTCYKVDTITRIQERRLVFASTSCR